MIAEGTTRPPWSSDHQGESSSARAPTSALKPWTHQTLRPRLTSDEPCDPRIDFFPVRILPPIVVSSTHRMSALDVILLAHDVVHQDPLLGRRGVFFAETASCFSRSAGHVKEGELDGLGRRGQQGVRRRGRGRSRAARRRLRERMDELRWWEWLWKVWVCVRVRGWSRSCLCLSVYLLRVVVRNIAIPTCR